MTTDVPVPPRKHRLVRYLLIALGIGLVLLLVALLLVRRALEPENVRRLVETQLTQALKVPVSVGSFEVSLLPPRVHGTNVMIGSAAPGAAPSLSLRGLEVVPLLKPLFSRRLVIDRIDLDGLAMTVRRDKNGTWHLPGGGSGEGGEPSTPAAASTPLPGPTPEAASSTAAPSAPSSAAPTSSVLVVKDLELRDGRLVIVDDVLRAPDGGAEVAAISAIAAKVRSQEGGIALDNLTAQLGSSTIHGSGAVSGSGLRFTLDWDTLKKEDLPALFGLLGSAPPRGLSIEGDKPLHLELSVTAGGKLDASGKLAADALQIGPLSLSKVTAPVTLTDSALALDPIQFAAYSASSTGSVKVNLEASPVAWTIVDQLTGLDVNQLLSATTSAKNKLLGTGRVDLNVRGTTAQPFEQQLGGTIEFSLKNGVIKDFPLLATLNRALGIAETTGNDTRFEGFDAGLTLGSGSARAERLTMTMGAISFTASGTLRLDNQALDLEGVARYADAQSGREVAIPVEIRGTASTPEFSVNVKEMASAAAKKAAEKAADAAKKEVQKGLDKLAGRVRKKP